MTRVGFIGLRKDVGLILDVARAQGAAQPAALTGLANAALATLADAGGEAERG